MISNNLTKYIGLFGETAEGEYFVVTYNPMVDNVIVVYRGRSGWDYLEEALNGYKEYSMDYIIRMKKTYSFETYINDKFVNKYETVYERPKKMTKEEIEKKLGYKVEIVENKWREDD